MLMTIIAEVNQIVAEVLEADPATLDPHASLVQDLGMDSVLAIDITTGLEKKFKVRIPEERMQDFESVQAIAQIIDELLRDKQPV